MYEIYSGIHFKLKMINNNLNLFDTLIAVLSFFPPLPIFQALDNFSTYITENNLDYFSVLDYLGFILQRGYVLIDEARLLLSYYLETYINIYDINRLRLPSVSFILDITSNLADISSLREFFHRNAIFVITNEYISGIWPNLFTGEVFDADDDFYLGIGSGGRDLHSTFRMLNHLVETFRNSSDFCSAYPLNTNIYQVYNAIAPVSADVPRSSVLQFFDQFGLGNQDYLVWVTLFANLATYFGLRRELLEVMNDPVIAGLFNILRELIRLFGQGPFGNNSR